MRKPIESPRPRQRVADGSRADARWRQRVGLRRIGARSAAALLALALAPLGTAATPSADERGAEQPHVERSWAPVASRSRLASMLGFKPLPAPEPAPPAADGGRVDAPDPNDPADRADPDDPDTGDPGRIDPATDVPSTDPVVEAADSARADLQAHWSSVGAVPSAVALVVVPDDQRLVVTACAAGPVDGSAAAFYCPADDTIVVARRILAAIERGFGLHAAEAIIAHEYAHNVQAERGLVFARVVDAELQADCLAGQWSRSRRERALVGQAGIDDAARLFWLLGDYEFGSADHHGTPGERLGAFYRGVDGRDCPVSWSALTGTAPAGAAADRND